MKKVFMFASAAIAALAMVSCNKEIEIQDQIAEGICPDGYYVEELVAEYPHDPETRTAFNETTGKFAWTEGDELAFHLSNGTYTSAPIDPATSKVKLYLPVGVTRNNYAVYPASAVVEEAATVGNMQVTLPSTYDISDNLTTEFVPMPLIATNDADNKKLKFEHVGALLQVNLNVPAGVKTATLSMGKTITGTFSLAAGSGNGIIEAGEASDDALTFVLSEDGLASETAVKLLAPLPSGTYEKFEVVYDNGLAFTKDLSSNPWEFDRTYGKKVSIGEDKFDDPINYFWVEALEENTTVSFSSGTSSNQNKIKITLYCSLGDKQHFEEYIVNGYLPSGRSTSTITLENVGDRVYFYGDNEVLSGSGNYTGYDVGDSGFNDRCAYFTTSKNVKVGGDLITLMKKKDGALSDGCFSGLFLRARVKDASELVFPDYTVERCYVRLFSSSIKVLESAPILPAKVLAEKCYYEMYMGQPLLTSAPDFIVDEIGTESCYGMFYECSGLTSLPKFETSSTVLGKASCRGMFGYTTALSTVPLDYLPSLNLGESCYYYMFLGSTLTNCPELPAENMQPYCYGHMFDYCKELKTPMSVLPSQHLAKGCYASMFWGAGIEVAPELPAIELADYCYDAMFQAAVSLATPPALNSMKLAPYCYQSMFYQTRALKSFTNLPATELKEGCYRQMFAYSQLETGPAVLPATELAQACYEKMFCNSSLSSPIELMFTSIPYSKSLYQMFMYALVNNVTVHFTEWPSTSYTMQWLDPKTYQGSAMVKTGSFYKPASLSSESDCINVHRIPSKWTIYNLEEVDAGV